MKIYGSIGSILTNICFLKKEKMYFFIINELLHLSLVHICAFFERICSKYRNCAKFFLSEVRKILCVCSIRSKFSENRADEYLTGISYDFKST